MDLKKAGKALLFPPTALLAALTPIALAFMVYSMVAFGTESMVAIASYALSAYTLTVWCFRIPRLIAYFKAFKLENKYALRWRNDLLLRTKLTLYGALTVNTAYAAFQLGLGIWHHTFWFYSLAAYYACLAIMRFFLARYTSTHRPGELMRKELGRYRFCGIVLLVMNLALAVIIFFMVYWNRSFIHNEITTITMAAYTFTAFTVAVIKIVKYRKLDTPVFSASKIISLAAACVSMLTLESTMLTTFGKETMTLAGRRIFLGVSGGAISAFIIAMAVCMIVSGTKKIKLLKKQGAVL